MSIEELLAEHTAVCLFLSEYIHQGLILPRNVHSAQEQAMFL